MNKERPIIMTAESVRAILNGRKTMTRRVVKPQPPEGFRVWGSCIDGRMAWTDHKQQGEKGNIINAQCTYGNPGDRLWVRETWAHDCPHCTDIRCGNLDHIWCRASEVPLVAESFVGPAKWRSPIFMPRWASRITLEIVDVRVERVREISEADAIAEGVWTASPELLISPMSKSHIGAFANAWNSINEKRGYGWDSNPWCWIVEFQRLPEVWR